MTVCGIIYWSGWLKPIVDSEEMKKKWFRQLKDVDYSEATAASILSCSPSKNTRLWLIDMTKKA